MAARPKNTQTVDLVQAFVTLESFGVTEDDPVSTEDFAAEMGITPTEAFNALDSLADAELVDSKGRGLSAEWWITVPDVSPENAESTAREALSNATPVVKEEPRKLTKKEQEYAERAAYNAYADERAQGFIPSDVLPAETPVIAEDGEKVTIPVDFDDPSKGRRELDAAKGERVISEETITVKATPERLPEIEGLDQFVDAETGDMVYESRIGKNDLALPEPSEVPPLPAGVNANVWDLAHTALTQSARDYWASVVAADVVQYELTQNQPETAPF